METTLKDIGVTSGDVILEISYLLAAILFVIGLKLMSHPESARKGNFWAAGGMGLAMITTLLLHRGSDGSNIGIWNAVVIIVAIIFGSIVISIPILLNNDVYELLFISAIH